MRVQWVERSLPFCPLKHRPSTIDRKHAFIFERDTHVWKYNQQRIDRLLFFLFTIIHFTWMYVTIQKKRSVTTSSLSWLSTTLALCSICIFLKLYIYIYIYIYIYMYMCFSELYGSSSWLSYFWISLALTNPLSKCHRGVISLKVTDSFH